MSADDYIATAAIFTGVGVASAILVGNSKAVMLGTIKALSYVRLAISK